MARAHALLLETGLVGWSQVEMYATKPFHTRTFWKHANTLYRHFTVFFLAHTLQVWATAHCTHAYTEESMPGRLGAFAAAAARVECMSQCTPCLAFTRWLHPNAKCLPGRSYVHDGVKSFAAVFDSIHTLLLVCINEICCWNERQTFNAYSVYSSQDPLRSQHNCLEMQRLSSPTYAGKHCNHGC